MGRGKVRKGSPKGSQKGAQKWTKIDQKSIQKMGANFDRQKWGFEEVKTIKSIELSSISCFLHIRKNERKRDQNESQNGSQMGAKRGLKRDQKWLRKMTGKRPPPGRFWTENGAQMGPKTAPKRGKKGYKNELENEPKSGPSGPDRPSMARAQCTLKRLNYI